MGCGSQVLQRECETQPRVLQVRREPRRDLSISGVGDLRFETSDVIQEMNFLRHAVRAFEHRIAHSEVFGDRKVWFEVEPRARVRQVIEFTRFNRLANLLLCKLFECHDWIVIPSAAENLASPRARVPMMENDVCL